MLSARHITLGFRTILVIRSHIAERPGDHGSGIDRIACSTFGPRGAGKVPLSQYGQILGGGTLHRLEQAALRTVQGPTESSSSPNKLHDPPDDQTAYRRWWGCSKSCSFGSWLVQSNVSSAILIFVHLPMDRGPNMFPVPTSFFLTSGVGVHRDRLTAFELALR